MRQYFKKIQTPQGSSLITKTLRRVKYFSFLYHLEHNPDELQSLMYAMKL